MKPKSPLTMKLAGKSPAKLDVVVNKPTPKEREPKPTPTGPKRRPQPVMPKRKRPPGGVKIPAEMYLQKKEGKGPIAKGAKVLDFDETVGKSKKSPTKLKKQQTSKPAKIKKQQTSKIGMVTKFMKDSKKASEYLKKRASVLSDVKKKTNTVGTGFMQPPYKDTVKGSRPYAKRQGYHGYKNFKSILKK